MKNELNRITTDFSILSTPEIAALLSPHVAKALSNNFADFVKAAWPILYPGRPLIWSWHYDYLCEVLMCVKYGRIKRLIFNVPPRTLKTTITTILYPVWVWLTDPSHQFLMASYSFALSSEHSILRRIILQSAFFQKFWAKRLELSYDRNQVAQIMNNYGGHMIASSVGGTVLGHGGDTAILDDPLSPDQAYSDVERTKTNNWIDSTFRTRLNDPDTGRMIMPMQRLHELDPTGFLLGQEPHVWTLVRIPLVAEEEERWEFPISGRIVTRKPGEVLLPKRFSPQTVEQLKSRSLIFASQYQGRPLPVEGNMIKRRYARYYDGVDPETGQMDERLPEGFDLKLISVDCSFKSSAESDYVAMLVIGVRGRKRYILDVINEHLDVCGTEMAIRRLRESYGPVNAVIVEDKANGPAVIQRLKMNVPGVIPINPKGGKVPRMATAVAEWQAGDWYVRRNAAWTAPFIEQITAFPLGRYDDMADAMSQAVCWLAEFDIPSVRKFNAFTGQEMEW